MPPFSPSALLPRLARPQGNQTIKDWMQIYSPSLHVFHPSDCDSEEDVLSLSTTSLILMFTAGLLMHPDPALFLGEDNWQQRKAARLGLNPTGQKQLN